VSDTSGLAPDDENATQSPSLIRQILELIVTVAIAYALAQVVRLYIAEGYRTPTASMVPTIQTEDFTAFSKLSYRFGSPQPGDIVTLDDPYGVLPMMMKRVIAVGGQTVDMRDGKVWVDGTALDESFTHGLPSLPGSVKLPITIPVGYVWVMGDNRTNSKDSRWFGPVPVSTLHAKALFRYWPVDRWGIPEGT
jgi:signal peptidase I